MGTTKTNKYNLKRLKKPSNILENQSTFQKKKYIISTYFNEQDNKTSIENTFFNVFNDPVFLK